MPADTWAAWHFFVVTGFSVACSDIILMQQSWLGWLENILVVNPAPSENSSEPATSPSGSSLFGYSHTISTAIVNGTSVDVDDFKYGKEYLRDPRGSACPFRMRPIVSYFS